MEAKNERQRLKPKQEEVSLMAFQIPKITYTGKIKEVTARKGTQGGHRGRGDVLSFPPL